MKRFGIVLLLISLIGCTEEPEITQKDHDLLSRLQPFLIDNGMEVVSREKALELGLSIEIEDNFNSRNSIIVNTNMSRDQLDEFRSKQREKIDSWGYKIDKEHIKTPPANARIMTWCERWDEITIDEYCWIVVYLCEIDNNLYFIYHDVCL